MIPSWWPLSTLEFYESYHGCSPPLDTCDIPCIPASLTHLEFGTTWNKELMAHHNLTHLKMGDGFNLIFPAFSLPSLTHLTFGTGFDR